MIMLLYHGQLDDYKIWTQQTHSVMHYWLKRQSKDNSGSYRGNFRLLLQCGYNKMIVGKNYNRYYIQMAETKNPNINHELLSRACELVQIPIIEFSNLLRKGRFFISHNVILPIIDPIGVDIELIPLQDISIDVGLSKWETEKDGVFLTLYDTDGYQIMKTPVGLLPTDYIPLNDEFDDFMYEGMSIIQLSNLRIFSMDFDFANLPRSEMINILNDIDVNRPKISDVTKTRLKGLISPDWEIKNEIDYFDDVDEKYSDESIMELLTSGDFTQNEMDELNMSFIISEKDPIYDDFLAVGFDWELINNLPTVKAMYQPQKILNRFLYCKYHFISRSCLDPIHLSKESIKTIYKQTGSKNLIYSLVYLYDKLFTNRSTPSPSYMGLEVYKEFLIKFNINQEEFNIL
jgi:hypothetical protein